MVKIFFVCFVEAFPMLIHISKDKKDMLGNDKSQQFIYIYYIYTHTLKKSRHNDIKCSPFIRSTNY